MLRRLRAMFENPTRRNKRGATFQQDELRTHQYQSSRDGIALTGQAQHQMYDMSYTTLLSYRRFGLPSDPRYSRIGGYAAGDGREVAHLGLGPLNAITALGFRHHVENWGGAGSGYGHQKGVISDETTGIKYNIHGYPIE